jgi:hypothetical protein
MRLAVVLSVLAMALSCSHPAVAAQTELLSIRGIAVGKNQYINRFDIQTWGVEILAVCHIPREWLMTAGNFQDPGGKISSENGGGGATVILRSDLSKLDNLVLVIVDQYQPYPRGNPKVEYHPATFSGSVTIGSMEADPKEHDVPLRPTNFVRKPASHCPTE